MARSSPTKQHLAMAIHEIIADRKLKPVDIAALFDLPQPRVSALLNNRLDGFSAERLMYFLTLLDQDVEIVIRPRGHDAGVVSVTHIVRIR